MASIVQIGKSWRALVRRKGFKPQSRTFKTKVAAKEWARRIEVDIDNGVQPKPSKIKSIADVILHYRELREESRPIPPQSNEHYMLAHLEEGLSDILADRMTIQDLTGWCRRRSAEGAGPYTIEMELSKLGTALKFAGVDLGIPLTPVIEQARPMLKHLGLIGPGSKRERRPMQGELDGIVNLLAAPYADLVSFSVASAMRRGEIVRMKWEDLDEGNKMVLIRDRKDPRQKKGNDQWVPMLGEAWVIIQRQPKTGGRVFPVGVSMVSKLFLAACRELNIVDLHFHDMRHEGISRLFEQGYTIEQVALVSGHKDWRHLRRYVQLRPENLQKITLPFSAVR